MKKAFTIIISISLLTIVHSGCKKSDREDQKDITTAIDNAEAQNVFDGIWREISELVDSSITIRSSCAAVTISSYNPSVWPKITTIDYGTTNCLGTDGNNRRGKVIASFSKKYSDSNTVINVSFDNFIHNDQLVEGIITITNKGKNTTGNYIFNLKVQNAVIHTSIGKLFWSANQTREWISGKSTPNYVADDIYLVTGTSAGTSLAGNSFSSIIDIPLRIEPTCTWTSMGSVNVYPKNYSVINVNYGNGTCDNVATAIINKKATEILLL